MGLDLIIRCENENLDWEFMILSHRQVQKAPSRDSEHDVVAKAISLKQQSMGDLRLDE